MRLVYLPSAYTVMPAEAGIHGSLLRSSIQIVTDMDPSVDFRSPSARWGDDLFYLTQFYALRATRPGWQTRVDEILRKVLGR